MFFIGKESYGKSDDNNNCNYRIFYDSVHRNVCTLRHGGIPDLSYTPVMKSYRVLLLTFAFPLT